MPLRHAIPCSSPQGRRKIIRKLLVKLKHIQADDVPIPNPSVLEIKFYLKTNRRCCTVFVQESNTLSCNPPIIPPELIPRFITSQLEAQKITDKHRQSVQLSTVLVLLSEYIVADPIQTNSAPTLFFWYDTNRRRTLYLFAYLDRQMESRTYSAAELLGLRPPQISETSHGVLAKLKADPEFDELVSKDKGNGTQVPNRAPRKPKEVSSSSNESDEVIYRGKTHSRHPAQAIPPGSNVQWKYRGRTGSEVTASDPLPAPSGLDKQSSEGFQRFFKAVVSPTHVRVTAGGRIVPNTRNSVSPTTKWDRERLPTDVQNPAEPNKELKLEPVFAPSSNQVPHPMIQPMYPAQPMVYQHMGMPVPVYHPLQGPIQHGFAYPYGFAPLAAPLPNTPYLSMSEREQRPEAIGATGKQNGVENDNRPKQAPIRISPPDQFDQNRPFYMNGQLVFPTGGMGPGTMPQMVANHYFAPGALPGPAHSGQRMAVVNAVNHPATGAGTNAPSPHLYSSAPDRNAVPQQSSTSAGPPPGTMPPLSSIRPSEITKKQLEGLRNSLKFLQMQVRFEMEHYPNMEPTPRHISEMVMPCNTPSRPPSIRHTQASGSSHHGSIRSMGATSGPKHIQSQHLGAGSRGGPKPNRSAVGINSNKTDNSTAHIDALEAAVIQKLSGPDATPEQKGMLEAITRPLNPHHDAKSSMAQQYFSDGSSSKDSSTQQGPTAEQKRVQTQTQPPVAYLQGQRRSGERSTGVYLTNGNAHYMAPGNGDGRAAPYLVGNYPPGTDPWTYLGHDFVYARELTEAERQARNVYWGKLPSKGTNLPKFDGKDFYPASPQKVVEQTGQSRHVSSGRPEIDPGFELRHSDVDPFRSSRDANSIRSFESGRRLSKAIPIVAPPDVEKKATASMSTNKAKGNEGTEELNKLNQSFQGLKVSPPDDSSATYSEKKRSPPLSRRALERSSVKSGHDLWQTMLKRGSTSGNVLPGAISSTTAIGYLPQFAGNAIASLGPTISNGSPARVSPDADDKLVELEGPRVAMEKVGENCPPSSAPSIEHDITKDLHQRMLRDAERRGIVGSDWQ